MAPSSDHTNTFKARLIKLDETISYQLYRCVPKSKQWNSILKGLEWSCHGFVNFVILFIALYTLPRQQRWLSHLIGGMFFDIFYVAILKALARRRRPLYANQSDQFMMVLSDKHSFPSGHASRVWFITMFVAGHRGLGVVTVLFIIWATCVAASRLLLGRHYLFDVVCGSVFGITQYWLQFGIFNFINSFFEYVILVGLGAQFRNTNDMDDATTFSEDL